MQYNTILRETNCICEMFGVYEGDDVHDQDLVSVKRILNDNSGKTTIVIFHNKVKLPCEHF